MNAIESRWWIGALSAVHAWTAVAHAQDACVAPAVEQQLTSCEGIARARLGDSRRPAASLPSPAPRAAQPSAATPTPGLEVDDRIAGPRAARIRGQQRRLIERERRLLERLAERTPPNDPQHAAVLERLTMTLGEVVRQSELRAGALEQGIHDAREAGDAPRAARLRRLQREARASATEAREAAVRTLAALVSAHPTRAGLDESLFTLAYHLERMSRGAQARQVYQRLVRDFPDSRWAPHAFLAFAEHAFAEGDMDAARRFYERVLEIPVDRNPLAGFARYKLAWVRFNQDDFRGALDELVRVLEHARQHPGRTDSASLARQARRELVIPYARVGRPDRALAFFRRVGESDAEALEMLESLGALYHDTGQWAASTAVHHALMAERRAADGLCRWQLRVLDATVATAPKDAQVREARRAVELRRAFEAADHPDDLTRRCDDEVATAVVLLATAWHREAIGTDDQPGTRDAATMDRAIELYALLDALPPLASLPLASIDRRDRPTAAEIAFFRADLLFERQRWSEAARAYEAALDAADDPDLAAEAAYGAVLAYDRHMGSRAPDERAEGPVDRRALTDEERRAARTFRRFACAAPDHEELPIVLYRWARLYFEANQLAEASVLFERVATRHPRSEVGEYAANLYLESLNALGQRGRTACFDALYASLDGLDARFCRGENTAPDLCPIIRTAHCHQGARRAEALGEAGRHREAAEALVELVRARTCDDAPLYLYNAAIHFEAARLLGRAIRVRAALVDAFGDHELARRAIFQIGANYHALAIYDRAADHYERYVQDGGRCTARSEAPCPDAAEGLRHAVLFRLGLGEPERAFEDAALFERQFARERPAMTAEVVFAIGAVHERTGAWDRMIAHYRAFLRRWARVATPTQLARANVLVARGFLHQDQRGRAEPFLRAAVAIHERGGEDAIAEDADPAAVIHLRDAVAEARYELAEARREAFEAEAFPVLRGNASVARVDRWAQGELAPWLERKVALLREAEAAYEAIAPLAVPRWRIAAASRIGDMYMWLVDRVRRSPVPDVIERYPEAYDAYVTALDAAVQPFEEVATARYESCLTTATAVRWFDERSRGCERALNRLDAARFPIASKLRGEPGYTPDQAARPGPVALDERERDG